MQAQGPLTLEKGKELQFDAELSANVEAFAKRAKVGDVSQPLRNSRNEMYLFQLTGILRGIASVMDSFEIRNKVSSKIVNQKAWPMMQARAGTMLSALKSGKTLDDVARGDSQVRVQNRQQVTPSALMYMGPEFAGTVMGLMPGQTSSLIKTERGLYIVRVDTRESNPMPTNPYQAQSKLSTALQKIRDAVQKRPKTIDYRNPFNL